MSEQETSSNVGGSLDLQPKVALSDPLPQVPRELLLAKKFLRDFDTFEKGLDIVNAMCFDPDTDNAVKTQALHILYQSPDLDNPHQQPKLLVTNSRLKNFQPQLNLDNRGKKSGKMEAIELLARLRDLCSHLSYSDEDKQYDLLRRVCLENIFNSHERMMTAVLLYNRSAFYMCYEILKAMCQDPTIEAKYRVDATRYLFASEDPEYREVALQCLQAIITTHTIPDHDRYDYIIGYMSKTGMSSILNRLKLKVHTDDDFVAALQETFVRDELNELFYRMLSAQALLGLKNVPQERKMDLIDNFLMVIAANQELEENTRADALDMVARLAVTPEQKRLARQMIVELGQSSKTALERQIGGANFFENSQNVHTGDVAEFVEKFIEKIMATSDTLPTFDIVYDEISALIREKLSDQALKNKAYLALHRVKVDTATFGFFEVRLSEVFVYVWHTINQQTAEVRANLKQRFVEELLDMAGTCSEGHITRVILSLESIDPDIRISYTTQLQANISGRLMAKIRKVEDDDLAMVLSTAMMDGATLEDVNTYNDYCLGVLDELYIELQNEFVTAGFMTQDIFETVFTESRQKILLVRAIKQKH